MNFLVEKWFALSFEVLKWDCTTFGLLWKITFGQHLENPLLPPGEKSFRRPWIHVWPRCKKAILWLCTKEIENNFLVQQQPCLNFKLHIYQVEDALLSKVEKTLFVYHFFCDVLNYFVRSIPKRIFVFASMFRFHTYRLPFVRLCLTYQHLHEILTEMLSIFAVNVCEMVF